eukprot:1161265-Pelagomonas_calceolata.AAC.11
MVNGSVSSQGTMASQLFSNAGSGGDPAAAAAAAAASCGSDGSGGDLAAAAVSRGCGGAGLQQMHGCRHQLAWVAEAGAFSCSPCP